MVKKLFQPVLKKLFWGGLRHLLSDKQYAKIRYWIELDAPLNLKDPRRFTEKIQYIKLNQRNPLRQVLANRIAVRSYVAKKAGEEYLIPLIGIYDELTPEIWETLPQQFVLKANHGCGMLHIEFDKKEEHYKDVYRQTEQWKQFDYAQLGREWAYENLPRKIVAEQLLLNEDQSIPRDYKFFCFSGRVELIQIDFERFSDQKRNLYDRNFNKLDVQLLYPNYHGDVESPPHLTEAIATAECLGAGLNFVRVDLYLVNDRVYFGELTNYPGSGFVPFKPESFEYKMGSYLKL